jgi:hypothetical protein
MSLSIFKPALVMGIALAQSMAWGQGALRDPTLPPPGAVQASPGGLGASGEALAGAAAQPGAALSQPTVQLMLVGPSRKYAVIDGQMLKPGGKIDQWRLTSIGANGVVMRSDAGSQKISAYPAVKKNVIAGSLPPSGSSPKKP